MKSNSEEYCVKCGSYLSPDAVYCMYCGSVRGEHPFDPMNNIPCIVYGPPVEEDCKCSICGHKWHASTLGKHAKFCPKCGNELKKGPGGMLGRLLKK